MHNGSEANATPFLVRYAFDGTKLGRLPIPLGLLDPPSPTLVQAAREICSLQEARSAITAEHARANRLNLRDAAAERTELLRQQVALQEKIDVEIYRLFDLPGADLLRVPAGPVMMGTRAFEGVIAQGSGDSGDATWFRWHDLTPPPSGKDRGDVQALRNATSTAQAAGLRLGLLECGSSKRRWLQPAGKAAQELETDAKVLRDQATSALDSLVESAVARENGPQVLRSADLDLAEDWLSACKLAGIEDEGRPASILETESVPFLAMFRFLEPGLEKHQVWQSTWDLQRREDAGESVGEIPVPPKYAQKDFRSATYWRLRGKLDVPKERFISYPGCESDKDNEPVYGWAGWDHAQRAQALAALYVDRKDNEGWSPERLQPMLAGLLELLPWVKQWHPDPHPDTGEPFGDFLQDFLEGECHALGFTYDDLRAWRPPKKTKRKKKTSKKKSTKKAAKAEQE
jgi:hypothetical protein